MKTDSLTLFDFPWSFSFSSDTDPLSQLLVGGDEDLQNEIHLSCHESRDVFNNELPDSSALISHNDIIVDSE